MTKSSLKIKVDRITPRIQYTVDFVFQSRGINVDLVVDGEDHQLDYTENGNASYLLYSENLELHPSFNKELSVLEFKGKADYLASIFYVLTRMEEYTSPDKDQHDRFTASQSILSKYNLLDQAICDRWADHLIASLGIELPEKSISFEPTFDIDNSFAYKHKTGSRRRFSILKDRLKNNKKRLAERKAVDIGGEDPYDTYEIITNIARQFQDTRIFWLVESNGKYDRNLDINHTRHQELIRSLSSVAEIGIHPSYKSFCSKSLVRKEKSALASILGTEINSSRQHFLRFTLPDSYRTLLEAGIKNDYSMGFADNFGFRAGTAKSFRWYDLLDESITELTIHPFVYMDGTLNEYLKLTPEQARDRISDLYVEVKRYGGTFRFIWHNETIGEYNHWKGWRSVLEHTLSLHHE
ncbi:MAG: hypothetical protein Crog4KO_04810 [Crocinitomicaceae bacterium]